MTQKQEKGFLESYLKKILDFEQNYAPYLCKEDFAPLPEDYIPMPTPEEERIASIADYNGFDGNLFRSLTRGDNNPVSPRSMRLLREQKETIPKIIAAINKPPDKSEILDNCELLTVTQVARILNCSNNEVYANNKSGNLPLPMQFGANTSTLRWSKSELLNWITAGCPARQKWELQKQEKAV